MQQTNVISRHLPCKAVSAESFLFCFIHHVKVVRVVIELGAIFSVCLLSRYHKSGSNSTGAVQCFFKTAIELSVLGEVYVQLQAASVLLLLLLLLLQCDFRIIDIMINSVIMTHQFLSKECFCLLELKPAGLLQSTLYDKATLTEEFQ